MDEDEKALSVKEAYRAMFTIINNWYQDFPCDELGMLLGIMQIVASDGKPADDAVWLDWIAIVQKVLEDSNDTLDKPWVMRLGK